MGRTDRTLGRCFERISWDLHQKAPHQRTERAIGIEIGVCLLIGVLGIGGSVKNDISFRRLYTLGIASLDLHVSTCEIRKGQNNRVQIKNFDFGQPPA